MQYLSLPLPSVVQIYSITFLPEMDATEPELKEIQDKHTLKK